ncbi:carbon-nitrogen hydrolase family protein [Anaerovorax odorimutans]|uniref:Carbon-nitrogen hydrolase family protein n=1 Tax=Anaerovorax odorimutans TaxID=109327 RepID=A0ABT1RRW9_9FIRM|nr:carbon-nitrogen hydrolase family protein [Anaerovorax odorimutans]MCQ4637948.1 carbon-nitrogen hydrolase family protein [Anaerovorax odorimutans]
MSGKIFNGRKSVKAAIAQISPVFMDKDKTIEKAIEYIGMAGGQKADIIVFPESFIPAFPYWQEGPNDRMEDFAEVNLAFQNNAVLAGSDDTSRLEEAARKADVNIVMGCTEMDERPGSRTLYNSMLYFSRTGELIGKHRKVVPTNTERCFHGMGQGGENLKVKAMDIGRVGGLVCWENHMIMMRALLACQGEEIHVACWPGTFSGMPDETMTVVDSERKNPKSYNTSDIEPAIRCHAFESQGFVLSACAYMPESEVPDDFPYKGRTNWDWAYGGSSIVDPFGCYIVEPVYDREELIAAELDSDLIRLAKHSFDVLGHYSRPDLVRLVYKDTEDAYLVKMSE